MHNAYRYGTPRPPIDAALAAGRSVLLEIDLQGARQVRAAMPEAPLVFLLPPSWDELVRRLVGRGTEDAGSRPGGWRPRESNWPPRTSSMSRRERRRGQAAREVVELLAVPRSARSGRRAQHLMQESHHGRQASGIIDPPIDELLAKVDSKYQLVIFASKRARQINDYYADLHEGILFDNVGPLVDSTIDDKPLSVALHEINEDKLVLERRRSSSSPRPMARRVNVVVGITGGIAAYKAVGVVRGLVLAGHDVHVVATEAALRFVGRPTLEAISRNPVHTELYEGVAEVRHVALGQAADLIVIAPATANTIAKLAAGLRRRPARQHRARHRRRPLVIAPAMHTEMWQQPGDGRQHRDRSARAASRRRPGDRPAHRRRLGSRPHGGARRDRRRAALGAVAPRAARATSPAAASWSPPAARASRSTRSASSATARAARRASRSPARPPRAEPRSR